MDKAEILQAAMDNPLTLDERELYYLAGLFDGEGTITLVRSGTKCRDGLMGITPRVLLTNTDTRLVQYVVNAFTRLAGSPPCIEVRAQKNNWNTAYTVLAANITKTTKILKALVPYLISKKEQANLVLRFNELRTKFRKHKEPYGVEELELMRKIRALNHRGVSETDNCERSKFTTLSDSPALVERLAA